MTAAIALEATGLANAANPAAPETLRYAHSTEIRDGAGALGLPLTWASAEELMTPKCRRRSRSTEWWTPHPNGVTPTPPRWPPRSPAGRHRLHRRGGRRANPHPGHPDNHHAHHTKQRRRRPRNHCHHHFDSVALADAHLERPLAPSQASSAAKTAPKRPPAYPR
ncbi:hypothetical protein I552_0507 [Mycobacterium xenopi 3993]|nr:hypothetical protein I552_0507 [Mycobacterium xenopi 3993]